MSKKYVQGQSVTKGEDFAFKTARSVPWVTALAAWLCAIGAARAAPSTDVVVVPMYVEGADGEPLWQLAEEVDDALERHSFRHLRITEVPERFARQYAREPGELSVEERESFLADAQKGLDAVTDADWPAALGWLRRSMRTATGALEATNRDQRTAEQLFQVCLLTVQVMAETDRTAARQQAVDCLVQSPNLELEATSRGYAPIVHEFLVEAQQFLAGRPAAPIQVTSEPSRCVVRVNGRPVGETPFVFWGPARRGYRVQVECAPGRPGRVHVATPADEPSYVRVDARFEDAVRIDERGLSLEHRELAEPFAREHLRALRELLATRQVLVVARRPGGGFVLQRLGDGDGAVVLLEQGYSPLAVAEGVRGMFERAPATSASPISAPAVQQTFAKQFGWWQKALAGSGAILGTATLGVAYAQHRRQVSAGDRYQGTALENVDGLVERGSAWADRRAAPYIFGSMGAGLLAASSVGPLLALHRRLPWWTTAAVSAAGAGLVAWGATDLAKSEHCGTKGAPIERLCVDEQDRRDRGGLLLLTSIPFVAVAAEEALRAIFANTPRAVVIQPRAAQHGAGVDFTFRL